MPCSAGSNCPRLLNPTRVHLPASLPICWRVREPSTPQGKMCLCVCSVASDSVTPLWDCVPPGSSVHGIHQARVLEWVAISSSRGSSQPKERHFFPNRPVFSPFHGCLFTCSFINSLTSTMCQALYQEPGFTSVKTQSLPSSGLCSQGIKQTLNKN